MMLGMNIDTQAASCPRARRLLAAMAQDLQLAPQALAGVRFTADDELPSVFAVSDFAAAAVATAGVAAAGLVGAHSGSTPAVGVNRRLASLWFGRSIQPQGWAMPAPWDPIAGDYRTKDGWIRLHTNAPHHRAAALHVLGVLADKAEVTHAVALWQAEALEMAVVERGGCAAAMRSVAQWAQHAQGRSVASEPLLATRCTPDIAAGTSTFDAQHPLAGVRVLDLTRVLAGPVATRLLAGLGADVLRIDPPDWDEPGVVPDVTLGKRCARLDLRSAAGRAAFAELLRQADVLVHGYRGDALDRLGLDSAARRKLRPGLVDVALDAYGWGGPWRHRRGFDSLVQMSTGIAEAGMRALAKDHPVPLPVQAVDHATGYLMAAAVLRGLTLRQRSGQGYEARASLARTAMLLMSEPAAVLAGAFTPASDADFDPAIEASDFGPARRLWPALQIEGTPLAWPRAATQLGSAAPQW